MLLDTNVIIDAAKPGRGNLAVFLTHANAGISIITRIEALGFHRLTPPEETAIANALRNLPELPLDDGIATRAIFLRQQKRMSLGDAIIAATALEYGLPLVTRNASDFSHVTGLTVINPHPSP